MRTHTNQQTHSTKARARGGKEGLLLQRWLEWDLLRLLIPKPTIPRGLASLERTMRRARGLWKNWGRREEGLRLECRENYKKGLEMLEIRVYLSEKIWIQHKGVDRMPLHWPLLSRTMKRHQLGHTLQRWTEPHAMHHACGCKVASGHTRRGIPNLGARALTRCRCVQTKVGKTLSLGTRALTQHFCAGVVCAHLRFSPLGGWGMTLGTTSRIP